MTSLLNRFALFTTITVFCSVAMMALLYSLGARFNISNSIPKGLYWVCHEKVTKGAYVLFCPPQRPIFDMAKARGYIRSGFCPGGYRPLMKKVLAVPDDIIRMTKQGMMVNEQILPQSQPLLCDSFGRLLVPVENQPQKLNQSEWLLMSDSCAMSFDGRYFGVTNQKQIKSVLRPVLTWSK